MKKIFNLLLAAALVVNFGCKNDPDEQVTPEATTVELSGDLSTQTLDASKKYLIKGTVFIPDGVTVTIPSGTVLMGDKATKGTLVVKMGGKLVANGTVTNPVVFTSKLGVGERDKGDWGGIILLGKANVNQNAPTIEGISPAPTYGTYNSSANDADNSGTLQYVRIEFAGIALSPNNETNSLTMGAVGNGTTIDHVQSSFGGDDAFEWFGGTVTCKNLIAFATWDDDFDCDFGFSGKVQYVLAIRDPFSADQSASNGFEVDNDGNGTTATPQTSPVFSNVTILGPKTDSNTTISGNYGSIMHLRRNSSASIFNSVFAGSFSKGLLLDGDATYANYTPGTAGLLSNNIMASTKIGTGNPTMFAQASGSPVNATVANIAAYWNASNKLDTIPTSTSKVTDWPAVGIKEALFFSENTTYPSNPDLTQVTITGTQMPTASFSDSKVNNSFFTVTSFVGAFGATDWTDGWAEFNPKNKAY